MSASRRKGWTLGIVSVALFMGVLDNLVVSVALPTANAVLSSVRPHQAGQASGANNAIREIGGVLGVAVLASIFTGAGSYASPQAFVDGLIPALWVGVSVLAAGALVVVAFPFRTRSVAELPTRHLAGDPA